MTGTLFCLFSLVSCAIVAYSSLNLGISILIAWGYFYGMIKAHYISSNGLFVFDAATVGFYLGVLLNPPRAELRDRYAHVFKWFLLLMLWPVFMAVLPIQHYLVQFIGLRGNIFWIPMILIGCVLDRRGKASVAYCLAIMNCVAFLFALGEFFIGVDAFVPENDATYIIHNSKDVAGGSKRIPSTFANAHSYSLFMVATIPWILGEVLGREKIRFGKILGMPILLGGLFSALLGIFIAGPRQPVVVLGLMLVLLVLTGRVNITLIILSGILGLIVAYFVAQEERMQRFTELQDIEAVQDRIMSSVHMGFFEILLDYPMGNGMGAGGTSLPSFAQALVNRNVGMENEYSRILLEQGLPGLILFLAFVLWLLFRKMAKDDFDIQTKQYLKIYSLVSFATSVIGLGLMVSVPSTCVLLLGVGFCVSPALKSTKFQTFNRNQNGFVWKSKSRSNFIPAYQRGLAKT